MRNILLTTALATLFTGVASAHSAHVEKTMKDSEGLSVSVGGSFDGQAATRSQKKSYTLAVDSQNNTYAQGITPGNKNVGFNTVAAIHAIAKNKTVEGTTYGAQIGILATTRGQKPAGKSSLDRTFLFVENDGMGRFEAGSNDGVASAMRTGADSIARATGGIDGDWYNYVALTALINGRNIDNNNNNLNAIPAPTTYLTKYQDDIIQDVIGGNEQSRKINYYTPEYNGFQAGLTYTPDARNSGQDNIGILGRLNSTENPYTQPAAKNAISGGLSWTGKFEKNQSLKVSVVGETSNTTVTAADKAAGNKYYDAKSVIVGGQYSYEDFSVAASYGNQGKSGFAKNTTGVGLKGGSFWTLGAAYVQGPVGASVTYMNSTLNKNTLNLISLGLDYQVAPGLLPYAEVTYFNIKGKHLYIAPTATAPAATNTALAYKNKGTAFILGTKLMF
ncbi:MAG: porin [Alphaproteobacteria bacterium]